jgi:hypothetical protein
MRRRLATLLAAACGVVLFPVPARGAPDEVVVAGADATQVVAIRPLRADLMVGDQVRRSVPLPRGPLHLDMLIRLIHDAHWATLTGGVATLHAELAQRPGTRLIVDAPVTQVLLVDTPATPAIIRGTGAEVTFDKVQVTAVPPNPVTGLVTGLARESAHRPYLYYTHNSVFTATNATFKSLGRPTKAKGAAGTGGVAIGANSTLYATDSQFLGESRGVYAHGAAAVRLTRVRVSGSAGAGIGIDRVASVTLTDVTASGNGTDGVDLRGPVPDITINGDTVASGNRGAGFRLSQLGSEPSGGYRTSRNTIAGVALKGCVGCVVSKVDSTGDGTGIAVDRASTAAVVRDSLVHRPQRDGVLLGQPSAYVSGVAVTADGDATGYRFRDSATEATLASSTVSGGVFGVVVDASGTQLRNVVVNGSGTGVRLRDTADKVSVTDVTMSGTHTGLSIDSGVPDVSVANLQVAQDDGFGVRSGASMLAGDGLHVTGARVGFDIRYGARIVRSSVADAGEAVRAGGRARVDLTDTTLAAHVLGVRVADGGQVRLVGTDVSSPLGGRGHIIIGSGTRFPPLPTDFLGIFALVALVLAILLESIRKARERSPDRATTAPVHVTNIS